jgi:tetratricopeptide (TPR) repeat protein
MIMGHGDEALEHSQRAVELDPFNPLFHGWYAYVLYVHRRYEEAIVAGREALRLQPEFPIATSVLWLVMHEVEGMEEASFAFARSMARVIFDDARIDTALDEGYARGGYAEGMKRTAEALIGRLPGVFCKPYDIATFYALAGEKDRALEWLEKAFVGRDQELPYLRCNPCFDDLRPDPRFRELLRKMNLPQ